MKKLVETNKQERNRRKRGEQGSVTLFVLIAMIFFFNGWSCGLHFECK